jgi:hypothetical protein
MIKNTTPIITSIRRLLFVIYKLLTQTPASLEVVRKQLFSFVRK